ncbi:hypothetical protein IFT84_17610 [Rhizobium sp. CFBP 8762]|uniref:DUF6197 family protein n=1 Tax=Rhizobium sp. CFBP 8762 TaxID=2775279 RepID=UPI00178572FD|nr:hypothetical protein [Rhizobium sp. CFBP 8762]MBD8556328.1 hypothetical protein [Rhizobium sp. CFBP 8762]
MTPVEQVLTRARDLIGRADRWSQEALARDEHGNECKPEDDKATCFCMVGALVRASAELHSQEAFHQGVKALKAVCAPMPCFIFNDSHGHRDVVRVFDQAIAQVAA